MSSTLNKLVCEFMIPYKQSENKHHQYPFAVLLNCVHRSLQEEFDFGTRAKMTNKASVLLPAIFQLYVISYYSSREIA